MINNPLSHIHMLKHDRHNKFVACRFRFIRYEVYSFHVYNKGIPFRNLLETLVLYKIGSQVSIYKRKHKF